MFRGQGPLLLEARTITTCWKVFSMETLYKIKKPNGPVLVHPLVLVFYKDWQKPDIQYTFQEVCTTVPSERGLSQIVESAWGGSGYFFAH